MSTVAQILCRNCDRYIPVKTNIEFSDLDFMERVDDLSQMTTAQCRFGLAFRDGEPCDHKGEWPEPDPSSALEKELTKWWEDTAGTEIAATVPKSVEYGAYDLALIGSVLADMIGWDESKTPRTEAVHVELGVFFYALGKVGRAQSAFRRSELPSKDTWFDAGVYARMAQRAREAGGWPGVKNDAS